MIALFVRQVFVVFQQQVTAVFEHLFLCFRRRRIFRTPNLVDHLAERLHQMKQVEHNFRLRTMRLHAVDVRLPHVHRHRFDPGLLHIRHPAEKRVQRFLAAALAHPYHPAAHIVQHHRHVPMAFLDGDFVNGQNAQTRIISLPVRRASSPARSMASSRFLSIARCSETS